MARTASSTATWTWVGGWVGGSMSSTTSILSSLLFLACRAGVEVSVERGGGVGMGGRGCGIEKRKVGELSVAYTWCLWAHTCVGGWVGGWVLYTHRATSSSLPPLPFCF